MRTLTRRAPRVEGSIAVAPRPFGRFAGDLIAPGETSGNIYAITPKGTSQLVANSGLPHGNDIGVESEAFVPRDRQAAAFLADRFTPGNRHPGDDVVLRILAGELEPQVSVRETCWWPPKAARSPTRSAARPTPAGPVSSPRDPQ